MKNYGCENQVECSFIYVLKIPKRKKTTQQYFEYFDYFENSFYDLIEIEEAKCTFFQVIV